MSAQNEPVGIGGAVIAVIVAVGPLLTLFGIELSPEALGAINTLAIAVVTLVTLVVRSRVSPVVKEAIEPVKEIPEGSHEPEDPEQEQFEEDADPSASDLEPAEENRQE